MAKQCMKCGKKLSAFGKVETKDGYICKQCAKKYKIDLQDKKIDFESKSLEELDASVEKKKKASTKALIIIMASLLVVSVGLMTLGGILEKNDATQVVEVESTTATKEYTTTETTTVPTTQGIGRIFFGESH